MAELDPEIFRDPIVTALVSIVREQHRLTDRAVEAIPRDERGEIAEWVGALRASFGSPPHASSADLLALDVGQLYAALRSTGNVTRYVHPPGQFLIGPEAMTAANHATHENALWVAIVDRVKAPQGQVSYLNLTPATLDHVALTQPQLRNLGELYDRIDESTRIRRE